MNNFFDRLFDELELFYLRHFSLQVLRYDWYLLRCLFRGESIHIFSHWNDRLPYVYGVSRQHYIEEKYHQIQTLDVSLPRKVFIQRAIELAEKNFSFIIFQTVSNEHLFVQLLLEGNGYLLDVPELVGNKTYKQLLVIKRLYKSLGFKEYKPGEKQSPEVTYYWIKKVPEGFFVIDAVFFNIETAATTADAIFKKCFRTNEELSVSLGDEVGRGEGVLLI